MIALQSLLSSYVLTEMWNLTRIRSLLRLDFSATRFGHKSEQGVVENSPEIATVSMIVVDHRQTLQCILSAYMVFFIKSILAHGQISST